MPDKNHTFTEEALDGEDEVSEIDTQKIKRIVEKIDKAKDRKQTTMNTVVCSVAIVSIAGLEAMALYMGRDGTYFAAIIGAICIIAGYKIKDILAIFGKK